MQDKKKHNDPRYQGRKIQRSKIPLLLLLLCYTMYQAYYYYCCYCHITRVFYYRLRTATTAAVEPTLHPPTEYNAPCAPPTGPSDLDNPPSSIQCRIYSRPISTLHPLAY